MDLKTLAHLISHDLKAPLNGIYSLVEFLEEDYADRLDDDGREQLRLIRQLSARGIAKVEALGAYSRAATAPCVMRPLDLTGIATRVAATAAGRVAPCQTDVTIAGALPRVAGDPSLVPLLLDRLFANAFTFNTQPARHLWFGPLGDTTHDVPAGHVALAVRDNGIGIPERWHGGIFDLFKRLHGPDKFGGGAGVGLTVARLIVRRHGGEIWVDRSSEAGTTLAFTLPAALEEAH